MQPAAPAWPACGADLGCVLASAAAEHEAKDQQNDDDDGNPVQHADTSFQAVPARIAPQFTRSAGSSHHSMMDNDGGSIKTRPGWQNRRRDAPGAGGW